MSCHAMPRPFIHPCPRHPQSLGSARPCVRLVSIPPHTPGHTLFFSPWCSQRMHGAVCGCSLGGHGERVCVDGLEGVALGTRDGGAVLVCTGCRADCVKACVCVYMEIA